MNKKQQGDIGVAMAIAHYTKQGRIVCYPLTDNTRYDLVVEIDGKLTRVQCKSTGYVDNSGRTIVALRTNGGNKSGQTTKKISAEECDLLFVYALDGRLYEFPPEVFDGKASLSLGAGYDSYKLS